MSSGVLWIRVSSEMQSHGYSSDAQEKLLEEAATKHNIPIAKKFKVAESAKASEGRKNFHEMVEFIKANDISHLIAYSTSRLARNYEDFYTIQELIDKHKLTVVVQSDGKIINRSSLPADRFMFRVMGDLAQLDNEQRGEATKGGMLEKVQQGGMPGHAPEGFQNIVDPHDPTKRVVLLEDGKKVALVREAFELYAEGGWSLSTLTEELNRRGFRTKPTSRHGNAPLTQHGLQKMLKNPFYYGMIKWSGQLFPGKHKPIVSKELFDRVQAQLAENCVSVKSDTKYWFAFKKFLKCGHCGSSMKAYNAYGNGKVRNYYGCTKEGGCKQGTYPEVEIDNLFAEALGDFYMDAQLAEKIKEHLRETHAESTATEKRELKRLFARQTERNRHLDLLYEDRLNEIITVERYKEKQTEIQNELKQIQEEISKLGKHNAKYREEGSTILELLNGFKKTYLSQDLKGKAQLLSILLERCEIMGSKSTNHTGSVIDKSGTKFLWRQPFNTLFLIGQMSKKPGMLKEKAIRGE